MLLLYKKYAYWYYAAAFLGVASLIVMGQMVKLSVFVVLPLGLLWIFAVALFLNKLAITRVNEINNVMMEKCDPKRAAEMYRALLEQRIKNNRVRVNILLNLSTAYTFSGEFVLAKEALDEIAPLILHEKNISYRQFYLNNLSFYYLTTEDIELAESTLNEMGASLPPQGDESDTVHTLYRHKQHILQLLKGGFMGGEEAFEAAFLQEEKAMNKVADKYYLGLCHLQQGSFEKARETFAYVLQMAPSTVYGQRAGVLLEKSR